MVSYLAEADTVIKIFSNDFFTFRRQTSLHCAEGLVENGLWFLISPKEGLSSKKLNGNEDTTENMLDLATSRDI